MGLPGAVPEFGWNHLPAQHFELCAVGVSRSVGTDSGPYGQKNQAERFAGCQSEPDVCSGLLIQRLVPNAHYLLCEVQTNSESSDSIIQYSLRGASCFTTPSVLSELFAKDRAIWDKLTPEIQETLENVDDYYSYLRSPGLSIAHYWGFLWANSVLPRFIPGYTPDMKLTQYFERVVRVELDSFGLNPDDEEE